MVKFKDRLKSLRIQHCLSFDGLAKITGLSSSSICRWENGQSDIKSEDLIVLAKFFGVSTDFMLGLE